MKKILLLLVLTLCITPGVVSAKENIYVGLNLGLTVTSDAETTDDGNVEVSFDNAVNIAGFIGYKFNNIRTELNLSYRDADVDKISILNHSLFINGNLETIALMLNGYYDFVQIGSVTPYINAGFGVARHTAEASSGFYKDSKSDTVLAFQLGTGISYELNETINLTLGYNYLGREDADFSGIKYNYDAHEIKSGINFFF